MNIFSSSSSSSSKFTLFSPSQNPKYSKFHLILPIKTLNSSPSHRTSLPIHSHDSSSSPALQEKRENSAARAEMEEYGDGFDEEIIKAKKSLEELLVIRRPVMEEARAEEDGGSRVKLKESGASSKIGEGLARFAKKMPIFEPKMVESSSEPKLLLVNLDLALYKAKILARNYRFEEAEEILRKCINYWPEDGRPYVALGKTLSKQSKMKEARAVYEEGCQATQGENSYIWQCWAVLESRMGNIRRARELFDAATVADKKHIAAWHGWAVLEMKEGNIKKARHLLGKGLKFCGGNEYIYQTLALLEVRAKRFEQARYLFRQATKCNPKSCASWLAWAQLEAQQKKNHAARMLFEKAVQASPKNRFAWHVWGVFEANLGNVDLARKLLMVGHAVNPRDPVLLQSLGLLEYRYSTANLARMLFKKASELDPRHQPVWIAWGWMEWKEGNLSTARELYQRALSIDLTTESAARCLQAWGVLEQRVGNLSAARRLFRSSLNINSQSYVTWMTWASLEEDQGNSIRAEEIRDLYFQQRTEIVDDASWIMGFLDIIDPAVDSIKRLLNLEKAVDASASGERVGDEQSGGAPADSVNGNAAGSESGFDLDEFIRQKLLLDPSNLEVQFASSLSKSFKDLKRMDSPDDDVLGDFMAENETAMMDMERSVAVEEDEEEDPFLKFIDYAKPILYENAGELEEEDPTRRPSWSWIATRILKTCVAYSSGVTPAILLSELSLAWNEHNRSGAPKKQSDLITKLKKKHKREKLANTITIDSIYEKKFLPLSSVIEAVVVDAFVLPGTNIYMLTLGDIWSSNTIDLYLHRRQVL